MKYVVCMMGACVFVCATGCERVPDEDIKVPVDAATVTPAQVTAVMEKAVSEEPAAAAVEANLTVAVPTDTVFVLAEHGPTDDDCAAAQVVRVAQGEQVVYQFGSDSAALRVDADGLPRGTQPRTLAALVNVAAPVPDACITAIGVWQPSNLYAFALSPMGTYFLWGYGQDAHSTTPIQTGTWVHLAATYDGTQAVVYVNGVEERRANLALQTTASPLQLGGRRFHGSITDVRIWQRVLSAEEVAAVAAAALKHVAVAEASGAEGASESSEQAPEPNEPTEHPADEMTGAGE